MEYFWETKGTIVDGVGFSLFDSLHLSWIAVFLIAVVLNCLWYRKMGEQGRKRWRIVVAGLIVLDEMFKVVMLCLVGQYSEEYLPLHLCSINIFMITFHAFKPTKLVSNFLYTVCIPGALAALLFPNWTVLPLVNFMHIHSSTVHILLALYPIVLAVAGDLNPDPKYILKTLGLLLLMSIPIYGINVLLDTNFMFLMDAETGNPLYWFEQLWGNHLLGFPVLIGAIVAVMYIPLVIFRKLRKK